MSFWQVIYSAFFFTLIELVFLFLYLLSLPFFLSPKIGRAVITPLFHYLLRAVFFIVRIDGNFKDLDKLPNGNRLVLISSSPCLIGSFVLYAFFPKRFCFVLDDIFLKAPISGRILKLVGCIGYNKERQAQFAWEINQALKQDKNLLIFPEKPRQKGEVVGQFKPGGISIAKSESATLVPIVLKGSDRLWPSDSLLVSNGEKMKIIIGDILDGGEVKDAERTTKYLENYYLNIMENKL